MSGPNAREQARVGERPRGSVSALGCDSIDQRRPGAGLSK